jgi:hypothetical protein
MRIALGYRVELLSLRVNVKLLTARLYIELLQLRVYRGEFFSRTLSQTFVAA